MVKPIRIDQITGTWTFLKSIDWVNESWLQGLIAFHITCLVLILLSRNYAVIQICFFLPLLLLVYMSEQINEWAAHNYKNFSKEQYFDSNGLFISLVFSLPALVNCLIIVIFWFLDTGKMLISVKKAKLKHERKRTKSSTTEETKKED